MAPPTTSDLSLICTILIWRRKWLIFLPGEFHGQRGLAGCSPWGRKELDATERLSHSLNVCMSINECFA